MKQPWASVDRWGPLAVSLLTFLTFIGYAWKTGERMARLEGRVAEIGRNQDEVVTLRERNKALEDRLSKAEEAVGLQKVYYDAAMAQVNKLQAKIGD